MELVLSTTWWMFPMDCLCICSRSCFGFTYVGEMSIHVVLNTCYISRSSTCKWFVSLYYTISPTFQVSRMVIVVQCIMVRVTICTSRWWWWSWVVWLLWESFSIFAFLLGDVVDTIKKFYLTGLNMNVFSIALIILLIVLLWFPTLTSIIYDSIEIVQFKYKINRPFFDMVQNLCHNYIIC